MPTVRTVLHIKSQQKSCWLEHNELMLEHNGFLEQKGL